MSSGLPTRSDIRFMQVAAGRRPSRIPRDVARRLEAAAERPSFRQHISRHLWQALSFRTAGTTCFFVWSFGVKGAAYMGLIYCGYAWFMDPHGE
jgi:hypothetical protein